MIALVELDCYAVQPLMEALRVETHPVREGDIQQALMLLRCKEVVLAMALSRWRVESDARVRARYGTVCRLLADRTPEELLR